MRSDTATFAILIQNSYRKAHFGTLARLWIVNDCERTDSCVRPAFSVQFFSVFLVFMILVKF